MAQHWPRRPTESFRANKPAMTAGGAMALLGPTRTNLDVRLPPARIHGGAITSFSRLRNRAQLPKWLTSR